MRLNEIMLSFYKFIDKFNFIKLFLKRSKNYGIRSCLIIHARKVKRAKLLKLKKNCFGFCIFDIKTEEDFTDSRPTYS